MGWFEVTTSSLHPHHLDFPTLYFVLVFYGVKPLSFAPYSEVFTQIFPTFRPKGPWACLEQGCVCTDQT